jgi:predicted O-methyltransferase YrrM
MNTLELADRLDAERPKFHYATEFHRREHAKLGFDGPTGDMCVAVNSGVLKWMARNVRPDSVTAETGAGSTTVVLASLASQHHCFTYDPKEREKIIAYLESVGIDPGRVTFHIGSTDETLPIFKPASPLDFVYIDGCHGYPIPALDWHYLDKHIRVGGIVGMDNVELRPVRDHCFFLEENKRYRRVGFVYESCFAHFYEKTGDDVSREWTYQAYSRAKKDPCDMRWRTRIRRKLSRVVKRWLD